MANKTAPTPPVDWSLVFDGCPGQSGLVDYSGTLAHQLYLLMADLESALDVDRAVVKGSNVTLMFQRDGIEATLWLVSQAWRTAQDLRELIENTQRNIDCPPGGAS
jgi:hypothetical protein